MALHPFANPKFSYFNLYPRYKVNLANDFKFKYIHPNMERSESTTNMFHFWLIKFNKIIFN